MIYEPSDDSYLLEKQVKIYSSKKAFLDIGSGSGIQAKAALNSGAKSIIVSDVNPKAIKILKSLGFKTIQSDLFSNIKGKFDLISFNPPYLPEDELEDKKSSLITSGGKKGDEIIIRFISKVKEHLNKNGIILLVVSSLTPKKDILASLKKNNLKFEVLSQKKLFMEFLEIWKITEKSKV